MTIRTTPQAVQNILRDNWDGETALGTFVETSSVMVDQIVANSNVLDATTLKSIEMYLAAHFYCVADPEYMSRTTSGASGQFAGKTDFVLKLTRYGQMAMLLDATGYLEKRSKEVEEGGRRMVQVYAATTCDNFATADNCPCTDE